MTDYTPWHRNIKPAKKYPTIYAGRNTHIARVCVEGMTDDEAEYAVDLIASAPRLKAERDELLGLAKANAATLEEQVNRFKHFGKAHEELDQAIKETRELIRRIDRE